MFKVVAAAVISGVLAFSLMGCQKEDAAMKDADTKMEQMTSGDEGASNNNAGGQAAAPAEQPAQEVAAPAEAPEAAAPAQQDQAAE